MSAPASLQRRWQADRSDRRALLEDDKVCHALSNDAIFLNGVGPMKTDCRTCTLPFVCAKGRHESGPELKTTPSTLEMPQMTRKRRG